MGEFLEGKTIVLVDSDRVSARVLTRQLNCYGVDVVGAPSGQKALSVLRGHAHSADAIVLVDWRLEQMGGDGLLNATAWLDHPPPVVVLAWTDAERDDALALGAAVAVVRPATGAVLHAALRRAPAICRKQAVGHYAQ